MLLMGKSTISMAIVNKTMLVYQSVQKICKMQYIQVYPMSIFRGRNTNPGNKYQIYIYIYLVGNWIDRHICDVFIPISSNIPVSVLHPGAFFVRSEEVRCSTVEITGRDHGSIKAPTFLGQQRMQSPQRAPACWWPGQEGARVKAYMALSEGHKSVVQFAFVPGFEYVRIMLVWCAPCHCVQCREICVALHKLTKEISQQRDLIAKRSHSKEISQQRHPTAKRRKVSDESLVFTSSTFTFWGTSRTKAWFSHLPSLLFEGSLAPKLHFPIFHFHFLRGVSHQRLVFTSSTFTFWWTSRTEAWFSHLPLSLFQGSLARNAFLKASGCT